MDGDLAMNGDDAEMYERLRDLEVDNARHDERIKTIEDFAKEMRAAITGMQIKLAGIVAIVTLGIQLAFKIWR